MRQLLLLGLAACTGGAVSTPATSATTGLGNTTADPLFVTTSRGPYRIDDSSPAFDRCVNTSTVDLDRVPRPQCSQKDAGAFEWEDCP